MRTTERPRECNMKSNKLSLLSPKTAELVAFVAAALADDKRRDRQHVASRWRMTRGLVNAMLAPFRREWSAIIGPDETTRKRVVINGAERTARKRLFSALKKRPLDWCSESFLLSVIRVGGMPLRQWREERHIREGITMMNALEDARASCPVCNNTSEVVRGLRADLHGDMNGLLGELLRSENEESIATWMAGHYLYDAKQTRALLACPSCALVARAKRAEEVLSLHAERVLEALKIEEVRA